MSLWRSQPWSCFSHPYHQIHGNRDSCSMMLRTTVPPAYNQPTNRRKYANTSRTFLRRISVRIVSTWTYSHQTYVAHVFDRQAEMQCCGMHLSLSLENRSLHAETASDGFHPWWGFHWRKRTDLQWVCSGSTKRRSCDIQLSTGTSR